jgi:5-methylcytosine-specific restriction endonuclease McrA
MDKVCIVCGKTFERPPHKAGNIKCCSAECMEVRKRIHDHHEWPGELYHGTCKHCGKEFTATRKRMYCPEHTGATARKQADRQPCKQCGKKLPPKRTVFCSDECKKRYYNPEQYVLTDEIVRDRIAERYDHIVHISGHESDGKIIVQCKVCGYEFIIGERASRVTRVIRCKRCYDRERRRKAKEKAKQNAVRNLIGVIRKRTAYLEDIESRKRECIICGKEFVSYQGNVFCSNKCRIERTRDVRRQRKHVRRARYRSSSDIITLRELYERDNGRCHLCGGVCDYDDMRIDGGVYIAGKRYPSIDHVQPLSKGGMHTWNNVRLACCRCNSLKSDSIL